MHRICIKKRYSCLFYKYHLLYFIFIKERFQYKVNQSIRNSKYYLFEFKLSISSLFG
nr:MAG TPA: hypothetical protein [Caudoviricetes sp.]